MDVEERAPFEVAVDVGVRYSLDKEVATGALVDLRANGPAGERLDPIRLRRGRDDRYRTQLRLPADGRWDLELRSAFPPGATTIAFDVAGSTQPDAGPDLTVPLLAAGAIAVGLAAWLLRWRMTR